MDAGSHPRVRVLRGGRLTSFVARMADHVMNASSSGRAATWPRAAASCELASSCSRTFSACCSTCSYSEDQQQQSLRSRQEIEQADQVLVELFARRHDVDLIGRAGGSLCRRIEPAQALDHVADELDANRLGVGRGKHVDDAAADGKRAVLVNRILAGETSVHEQVRQSLRLDFRSGAELDGGAQQPISRTHRGQQRGC